MNEQPPVAPMSIEQRQMLMLQMMQQTPKKSKVPFVLSIVFGIFFLVFGSLYAYYLYSTSGPAPKDILKKSIEASYNVKSFSFMATSTGQVESQAGQGVPSLSSFTLTSNGSVDIHSLEAPLFSVSAGLNAGVRDATSTGALSLGVEALYSNKNFYVNLKNFNATYVSSDPKAASMQLFVGMANGIAASFLDKWTQVDMSKSAQATSTQSSSSTADIAALREYALGMRYVTDSSYIGDETVNGVPTYHFKFTVQNSQEFADLMKKKSAEKLTENAGDATVANKRADDLSKVINQKIDLDLWIGRSDSLIYKVVSSPISINDTQTTTKSTTSQEISFSNYNQPFTVVAPQGAMLIEQVMQTIFASTFGNKPTAPIVSQQPKEELNNARAQAELYFDGIGAGSYARVCLKGQKDGIYSYVQSAATAAGVTVPVKRYAATTRTTAVCNDSAKAWVAQVPLKNESPNFSWCVDSTGVSKPETNKWLSSGRAVKCP